MRGPAGWIGTFPYPGARVPYECFRRDSRTEWGLSEPSTVRPHHVVSDLLTGRRDPPPGKDHSNVTEEKLRRTQEALTEAEKERITKQAEHELIAAATKESLPAVLENPAVREEQTKLEQLRSQLAELKTYMAPGHARII